MYQEIPPTPVTDLSEIIKTVAIIATLLIAITNLILTIIIFRIKDKKEDAESDRKLKLEWFNKLILDYNLTYFHNFFENISKELELLKTSELDDSAKGKILDSIKDHQKDFRIHFVDSLLAVDKTLYDKILSISDTLIDDFTNAAFNPGIKLSHPPKFDEEITVKLTSSKTKMIQELFKFDGNLHSEGLQKTT